MTFRLTAIAVRKRLLSQVFSWASLILRGLFILILIFCLNWPLPGLVAYAQTAPILFKQDSDRSQPESMTTEELTELNDPFFNLVLRDHGEVTTLEEIAQQLQPDQQDVFAVHERIVDDAPLIGGSPASRRGIVTFSGMTGGEELQDNLSLSVFFNSEAFPSTTEIEAMAWDDAAGKFNYYKLDQARDETTLTWKFRGDSRKADLLSSQAREGTCMACHINGGMVMKEFKTPWNNWHSRDFDASYLRSGNDNAWPVAEVANSPLQNLRGARDLEFTVDSANTRLNQRRIAAMHDGGSQVTDVKRLLKPLFVTTEANLMSSFANSENHPFGQSLPSNSQVDIPLSFFLNDTVLGQELGISTFELADFARLSDREYNEVVNRGKTTLAGQSPGDTHFAWFTPEASVIDNAYGRQLMEQGIVPQEFVAAVMAVDLETPVFSKEREGLWAASNILPAQFKTGRNNDLIAQTVSNLEQLNPAADSAEGQFLAALQSSDPVQFLRAKVDDYILRERRRFGDRETRPEEVARLYRRLLERRQQVEADPVQQHLIENPLLFPSGDIAALPVQVADPVLPNRPTLALGDRGEAVVTLQELLQRLGFLTGSIDGDFGPATEQAVIAAQRSLNLVADGIVGPATWATLDVVAERPLLQRGDRGDDVVDLQRLLQDRGFLNGSADGDFGPGTEQAVLAAQRQFGLDVDGIVGPATWARLSA